MVVVRRPGGQCMAGERVAASSPWLPVMRAPCRSRRSIQVLRGGSGARANPSWAASGSLKLETRPLHRTPTPPAGVHNQSGFVVYEASQPTCRAAQADSSSCASRQPLGAIARVAPKFLWCLFDPRKFGDDRDASSAPPLVSPPNRLRPPPLLHHNSPHRTFPTTAPPTPHLRPTPPTHPRSHASQPHSHASLSFSPIHRRRLDRA